MAWDGIVPRAWGWRVPSIRSTGCHRVPPPWLSAWLSGIGCAVRVRLDRLEGRAIGVHAGGLDPGDAVAPDVDREDGEQHIVRHGLEGHHRRPLTLAPPGR